MDEYGSGIRGFFRRLATPRGERRYPVTKNQLVTYWGEDLTIHGTFWFVDSVDPETGLVLLYQPGFPPSRQCEQSELRIETDLSQTAHAWDDERNSP
jgi:hypothetical protein